jgi:hypothetical protein
MSNYLDYPNVHDGVLSLARSTESEFGRTLFHALLSFACNQHDIGSLSFSSDELQFHPSSYLQSHKNQLTLIISQDPYQTFSKPFSLRLVANASCITVMSLRVAQLHGTTASVAAAVAQCCHHVVLEHTWKCRSRFAPHSIVQLDRRIMLHLLTLFGRQSNRGSYLSLHSATDRSPPRILQATHIHPHTLSLPPLCVARNTHNSDL